LNFKIRHIENLFNFVTTHTISNSIASDRTCHSVRHKYAETADYYTV